MENIEQKTAFLVEKFDSLGTVRLNFEYEDQKFVFRPKSGARYFLGKSQFKALTLICTYGFSNEQLAQKMNLTIQTVKNIVSELNNVFILNEKDELVRGDTDESKVTLINTLIKEGLLKYIPPKIIR